MKPERLVHRLSIASWIGLALIVGGFHLALFTDVTVKYGITGLRADAELIGLGFLLFAPSKLILTFRLIGVNVRDGAGEDREGR
jgi:hypothetical protein